MSTKKCPGSLGFAEPRPADIACPTCGTVAEIWSDEATARCASCGKLVIRTDTQSCLDWCRYAKECLGEQGYRDYGAMKAALRQAALFSAVEARLGEDSPALAFSRTVARFTEQLCSQEILADPMVAVAAAVLLCLAKPEPGDDDRRDEGKRPAADLAAVAAILKELHYADPARTAVEAILRALPQPAAGATPPAGVDYGLVHDAVLLDTLEHQPAAGRQVAPERLLSECLTDHGRALVREMRRALSRQASGG